MKKSFKIAFTGPESSGKTTLSNWLANEINGVWCEEFARKYLSNKKIYNQEDLTKIAKGQLKIWESAIQGQHLISDTELIVIEIWSKWKYNSCDTFILEQIKKQTFNIYFLCKPDIPWTYDPLRESPMNRDELFEIYKSTFKKYDLKFVILEGNLLQRKNKIKQVLKTHNLIF